MTQQYHLPALGVEIHSNTPVISMSNDRSQQVVQLSNYTEPLYLLGIQIISEIRLVTNWSETREQDLTCDSGKTRHTCSNSFQRSTIWVWELKSYEVLCHQSAIIHNYQINLHIKLKNRSHWLTEPIWSFPRYISAFVFFRKCNPNYIPRL